MKKIVCPRCGAINLEKFITFPHCAGCNALLPSTKNAPPPDPFWRRPLRGWLWAGLLGGAGISVLAVVLFYFQSTSAEFGQLLIYGEAPRRTPWQRIIVCRITLDTIGSESALAPRKLRNVRVRLPHRMDRAFDVISVVPTPDVVTVSGAGRYLNFDAVALHTPIKISLRPRQAGKQKLEITVHAEAHFSAQYSAAIEVGKPPQAQKPVVQSIPRSIARTNAP